MGDSVMAGKEKIAPDFSDTYWTCAEKRRGEMMDESGNRTVKYFLVTDSSLYKKEVFQHYGADRMVITDTDPVHIAKMQLQWDGILGRANHGLPPPTGKLDAAPVCRCTYTILVLVLCICALSEGFTLLIYADPQSGIFV